MDQTAQQPQQNRVVSDVGHQKVSDVVRPELGQVRSNTPVHSYAQHDLSDPATNDPASGMDKEREPLAPAETAPVVELHKDHEVEPEVEGWLEKLEREGSVALPDPIKDDNGNVVMQDVTHDDPDEVITLPMTHDEMATFKAQKVSDSGRWLSEWAERLRKMLGNAVRFRQR